MADGQLGGITFFSDSIDAVASLSNIAAALRKRITIYKPAFAFFVVDKAIEDVVLLIHIPMT